MRVPTAGWLLCAMLTGCQNVPDTAQSRQLLEAQQTFEAAVSPEDYLAAAAIYQELREAGYDSGGVLYNQGNAYVRAEKLRTRLRPIAEPCGFGRAIRN